MNLALIAMTLLACGEAEDDSGATGTCEPPAPAASVLAACVVDGDGLIVDSLEREGLTVVTRGEATADACVDPDVHEGSATRELELDQAFRLQLEDDAGDVWTVVVHSSEALGLVFIGDTVDLRWSRTPMEPFAGEWGAQRLELRDEGGLMGWLARGHSAGALGTPPELALFRGDVFCQEEVECGTQVDYLVRFETGGDALEVEPGTFGIFGDYHYSSQPERSLEDPTCSEQEGASGGFAVVRVHW